MKNPWFRLYSEFATDPKVQSLPETFQRRYIMLLCLKCSGDLDSLNEDEIAFAFRISMNELEECKQAFVKKGFIDDSWSILNWDKRQFISDDVTKRVQRFRDKKRVSSENETFQKRYCNGDVTEMKRPCNAPDTDTDTDTEKKKKHTPKLNGSCPHEKIIDLYHELLPQLPRVKEWTPPRQAFLRSRWSEKKERQNIEWWEEFFKLVGNSDFLTGRVNDFKADLEWLIRPKNFPKVLEGRYSSKGQSKSKWF